MLTISMWGLGQISQIIAMKIWKRDLDILAQSPVKMRIELFSAQK